MITRAALTLTALTLLATPAGAATFRDQANGFSVVAPAGWKQGSFPGVAVVFAAPPVGGFAPNVNVMVQPLPAGITQASYHALSIKQIAQLITDGKVISNRQTTLGGVAANEVVYSGRQGQYRLIFMATYAVRERRAYVVTTTTLQGKEAAVKPVHAAFVKNFRFLP